MGISKISEIEGMLVWLKARPVERLIFWVCCGMVVLSLGTHLRFLTEYPLIYVDEGWNANAVWSWVTTGVLFETMHRGTLDQFGYEWVHWPYIGMASWWLAFKFMGVGLWQARFVSWVWGALLLVMMMWVGQMSSGRMTGILAALLLSLTAPFTQASHYARQDIVLATWLMATYGLALWNFEHERAWAHFGVGLCAALAVDIHQFALFFGPSLIGLYLVAYGLGLFRRRGTWLCALGGLLGLGYYGVLHILPNPDAYYKMHSIFLAYRHALPIYDLSLKNLLMVVSGELTRYNFWINGLEFVLIGTSGALLLSCWRRSDRFWLIHTGIALMTFTFLSGSKSDLYAILLYPFFMLGVAEAFSVLLHERHDNSFQKRLFAGVLLMLFIAHHGAVLAQAFSSTRAYRYDAIIAPMRAAIPPNAKVMASPNWWFGFVDYDFQSSLSLGYYHFFNGYNLETAMNAIKPDYFIIGPEITCCFREREDAPWKSANDFSHKEFEAFLKAHAHVHAEFTDPYYGAFKIYAIQSK